MPPPVQPVQLQPGKPVFAPADVPLSPAPHYTDSDRHSAQRPGFPVTASASQSDCIVRCNRGNPTTFAVLFADLPQ